MHFKLAFVEVHFDMHLASTLEVNFCWSVPQSVTRTSMRHSYKTEFGILKICKTSYKWDYMYSFHTSDSTYTFDIGALLWLYCFKLFLFLFLFLFRRYFDPATTYPQFLTQYTAETFCASFHFKCPSGFQFNATDLPRSRVRVFLFCSDFPSSCIAPILILSGKEFRDNIIWYL